MLGQRIGNYQILEHLGEGGMGTVYLALHPELGRRAAVKVLHPDLALREDMLQRFFNEARAANAIGHRGIVEVSDLGVLPSGAPYIVMEFLEGESLTQRMTRAGRLPLAAAVGIAVQISSVVGAAHGKGIVHRDIKPDNLFLVPDSQLPGRELLKVLDFGIAKLAQSPAAGGDLRTRTGAILGTPRYMSPEQCRDSRDVDHRTDIYSLGVVLYEMLSGTPPFVSNSWGELAHMHIGVSPPALLARAPDVPAPLAEIVHRALEKDPGARFQSMAELELALLEAAGGARTLVMADGGAGPVAAAASAPQPESGSALGSGSGSTRRLEDEPVAVRAARRTTLAGAAAEVERAPGRSKPVKRAIPVLPALVVGIGIAAIVVVGVIAARRAPAPAPAPVVAAPAAAATPSPMRASAPVESAPHPNPLPAPRRTAPRGEGTGDEVGKGDELGVGVALPARRGEGTADEAGNGDRLGVGVALPAPRGEGTADEAGNGDRLGVGVALPAPRGEGTADEAGNGERLGVGVALPAPRGEGTGDEVGKGDELAVGVAPRGEGNGGGMTGERERKGRWPAHRPHAPGKSSAPAPVAPPTAPPSKPRAAEPLKI